MWGFFILKIISYICIMGQTRNKTGIDFEKILPKHFIRKPTSPRIRWIGSGKNNLKKIVEHNFDETKFVADLTKTVLTKYDWIDTLTDDKYEVKKYNKSELKHWTLYSEPYFKMSSKQNLKVIDKENYNSFVGRFFELNTNNGFFEKIILEMISKTKGIYVKDGMIPMTDLEFKTVIVHNQWKGYDRITIMFRLK